MRTIPSSFPLSIPFLPLAVLGVILLSSCSSSGSARTRKGLAIGEGQLLARNYSAAAVTFRDTSGRMLKPRAKSAALLGLGRAQLGLDRPDSAIHSLTQAQKTYSEGATGTAIARALGAAHFQKRQYRAAYSHLRSLPDRLGGRERERVIVELAVCAQNTGDRQEADRYLAEAKRFRDPALRSLLKKHLRRETYSPKKRPPRTNSRIGRLPVISRRQWDASPIRSNVDRMGSMYRITVHHSGMSEPQHQSKSEAANVIKKIQSVHQRKGWADIGYHYVIDRTGLVWEGRPLRYQGAHARGSANRGNIGVVLLGDFTSQRLTRNQLNSLEKFLGSLCKKHRISRRRVYTHSEILSGKTECPGPEVSHIIRRFRSDLLGQLP